MNKVRFTATILCASLAFAACTKTAVLEPAPAPAETPVTGTGSGEELKLNLTVTLADAFGDVKPGTKALKTGWAVGDVIYVFFRTDVHKYLELKYNGAKWTATRKNGLTESDITGSTLRKLRASATPAKRTGR